MAKLHAELSHLEAYSNAMDVTQVTPRDVAQFKERVHSLRGKFHDTLRARDQEEIRSLKHLKNMFILLLVISLAMECILLYLDAEDDSNRKRNALLSVCAALLFLLFCVF